VTDGQTEREAHRDREREGEGGRERERPERPISLQGNDSAWVGAVLASAEGDGYILQPRTRLRLRCLVYRLRLRCLGFRVSGLEVSRVSGFGSRVWKDLYNWGARDLLGGRIVPYLTSTTTFDRYVATDAEWFRI
jgi:hypothetical protein